MSIQYKTEGSFDLKCRENNSKPMCLRWVKGSNHVTLHSGGAHVQITRSQLLELRDNILSITEDLQK